ncbi:hypothetical protein scyTo_0003154 [Scyliorhinus torazame]|uniref:Reverse transcriptase/retrotransposon-derived protein RNase H-like domain-containing protein n=1 Tax=Scyliorhinus torazame TaxID=75743 RepID=A0A401PLS5_SCYTO|nr:hypothetical protein [Scyliorhinus torazame]
MWTISLFGLPHRRSISVAFQRIWDQGLGLNRAKCSFGQTELKFLGDHTSRLGVRPDADKVAAITAMQKPTDKKAVLRFLGMVNFLGKFIPNLASHITALWHFVRKTTEFQWLPTEREELKVKLTTAPVLAFFDPARETKISTDASQSGIGAILLQRDDASSLAPVAYASRVMTPTEQHYAQIEKECLGLLTGVDKLHDYVYGLPQFTVETNHRPLVGIIQKDLNDMTPRLQRILLKLRRYDFQLVYTPPHELVTSPWSKLGVDLFHALGRDDIIIIDYFSSYPEVIRLHGTTLSAVIRAWKETFAHRDVRQWPLLRESGMVFLR